MSSLDHHIIAVLSQGPGWESIDELRRTSAVKRPRQHPWNLQQYAACTSCEFPESQGSSGPVFHLGLGVLRDDAFAYSVLLPPGKTAFCWHERGMSNPLRADDRYAA